MNKIALVTGANKGLGFATAKELAKKGYKVILTARNPNGSEKVKELQKEGLDVEFRSLDVKDSDSIQRLVDSIQKDFGKLDVLVNNAAVLLDKEGHVDKKLLQETLDTNVIGAYLLCEKILPLMKKNGFGRIVNISSGMGQLSEMSYEYPAYRISKAALNAVTKIIHAQKEHPNILVNSVCPGWVKTDMGGPNAQLSIDEGVKGIVWAATLADNGPSGGFFRHGEKLDW